MRLATTAMLGALALLAGCGEVPFDRLGDTSVEFRWADPSGRSLMGRTTRSGAGSGETFPTSPRLDPLFAYYNTAEIGTRIATVTPTKVKGIVSQLELLTTEWFPPAVRTPDLKYGLIELGPWTMPPTGNQLESGWFDRFAADFTDPALAFVPPVGVPAGRTYPGVYLWLKSFYSGLDGNGRAYDTVWLPNEVEVDLPGYAGVFHNERPTPPLASDTLIDDDRTHGEHIAFMLNRLITGNWLDWFDDNYIDAQHGRIIFDDLKVLFMGDRFDYRDWEDNEFANVIVVPQSPITVPAGTSRVTFRLTFDVQDLVEVYDNNTPGVLTDDIVVFANRWWERFRLVPTFH